MEIFTGDLPFIELTREEMLKEKYSRSILPIIYGYLVPKIKEKYGIEKAIEVLKNFGKRVLVDVLEYWKPKNSSLPKILQEVYKFIFYIKLKKIKPIKETPRKWIIYDDKCPLCWEGVEETDIHYCIAIAGAVEGLLNKLNELGYKKIPRVKVNTLTSKARGDKICTHEIVEVV
ncbi:MAG: hypothetical protein ACTSRG_07735 [Candidatus Helarchaeota archaeon]